MYCASRTKTSRALIAASLLILNGCGTVPSVPPTCPSIPELTVREPLGPTFRERMQPFLSGKLPERTDSEPLSPPAIVTPTH